MVSIVSVSGYSKDTSDQGKNSSRTGRGIRKIDAFYQQGDSEQVCEMLIFLIMEGWGVGNSKTERVLTWREPCGIALEDPWMIWLVDSVMCKCHDKTWQMGNLCISSSMFGCLLVTPQKEGM